MKDEKAHAGLKFHSLTSCIFFFSFIILWFVEWDIRDG